MYFHFIDLFVFIDMYIIFFWYDVPSFSFLWVFPLHELTNKRRLSSAILEYNYCCYLYCCDRNPSQDYCLTRHPWHTARHAIPSTRHPWRTCSMRAAPLRSSGSRDSAGRISIACRSHGPCCRARPAGPWVIELSLQGHELYILPCRVMSCRARHAGSWVLGLTMQCHEL